MAIMSGYMVPINILSDSAYLIAIGVVVTMPYVGPAFGTLFVGYLMGEEHWDFRYVLLLHTFIAFNLVVCSVSHIIIVHIYGSSTVEKGNIQHTIDFLLYIIKYELQW